MSPRLRNWVAVAIGIAVALVMPHVLYPTLALDILLWGLFAVAVDLLLGFGGLLSFGHAAFWGSAAYAAAISARAAQIPFPIAAAVGILVALLLALPIGYLSIRRKGIYFSMVTLAFAQMVFYVANEWRPVTGGENGVQGVPRLFPGVDLQSPLTFYYAALPFVLLALWLTYRIVHSPFGHVLVSIRDNEARAQALGYPTQRYKLVAFLLSAGLAGLAGSLFSLGHGFAALDLVHWTTSGTAVVMTILGGIGTLWGSLIGAGLVLLLRDWLSTLGSTQGGIFSSLRDAPDVVTGAIFVIVVLSFRRGLWYTFRHLMQNLERRRSKAVSSSPEIGGSPKAKRGVSFSENGTPALERPQDGASVSPFGRQDRGD
ncbi:MAG: branched-chain amino acid ABC transporter permease [Acidobacteriota bacterium]